MTDDTAKRLAGDIQKLSVLLAVGLTHMGHLSEEILAVSNVLAESAFTLEDIFRDLPPEVKTKLKIKDLSTLEGLDSTVVGNESLVDLLRKVLKGGRRNS